MNKELQELARRLKRNESNMAVSDATTPPVPTPTRAARRLNDHHMKTAAGFYPTSVCSRAFGARVRGGILEITPDFETWCQVDLATVEFRDHNGRKIFL